MIILDPPLPHDEIFPDAIQYIIQHNAKHIISYYSIVSCYIIVIESKYESILIMLNKIILYGMIIYNFNLDENSLIKTYEKYEKQCVSACNFFLQNYMHFYNKLHFFFEKGL